MDYMRIGHTLFSFLDYPALNEAQTIPVGKVFCQFGFALPMRVALTLYGELAQEEQESVHKFLNLYLESGWIILASVSVSAMTTIES
jgi:hypothetical protein